MRMQEAKTRHDLEERACQKEVIARVEKAKKLLNKREDRLKEGEKKARRNQEVAQRMLDQASKSLNRATDKEDMVRVKVAREMVEAARSNFKKANTLIQHQHQVRHSIAGKRKKEMQTLVDNAKQRKSN